MSEPCVFPDEYFGRSEKCRGIRRVVIQINTLEILDEHQVGDYGEYRFVFFFRLPRMFLCQFTVCDIQRDASQTDDSRV